MGEHRTNANALAAAAAAMGARVGIDLRIGYVPKTNVIVLPDDKIREVDGQVEVYGKPVAWSADGVMHVGPEACWHQPPPDARVVHEGTQLTVESMDIVVTLMGMVKTSMTDAQGRPVGRMRVLRELFREDAREFGINMGLGPVGGDANQ